MIVFPLDPLGRIESGDGIVEGRDVADVRPQSSVTHPLDDLTQLGAIRHENNERSREPGEGDWDMFTESVAHAQVAGWGSTEEARSIATMMRASIEHDSYLLGCPT